VRSACAGGLRSTAGATERPCYVRRLAEMDVGVTHRAEVLRDARTGEPGGVLRHRLRVDPGVVCQ
jgi:hypothetical protein